MRTLLQILFEIKHTIDKDIPSFNKERQLRLLIKMALEKYKNHIGPYT